MTRSVHRTAMLLLALLLSAATALAGPGPARAEAPQVTGIETDLGVQIPGREGAVRSEQSAQGLLPGGRYVAGFASSGGPGTPARFFAMDLTGQTVAELTIPDGIDVLSLGYSATSRSFFLAANAASSSFLYQWDGGGLEQVATLSGHLAMRLAIAPDGAVYVGTFAPGNGRLFRYAAGALVDLGQPVPGESYVRSLAVDASSVWTSNYRQAAATLVRVDRASGARSTLAVPAAFAGEWGALDMSRAGDYLFLRTVNSAYLFAYNTVTGHFDDFDDQVDRVHGTAEAPKRVPFIQGISPYGISPLIEGRYVYFQRSRAGIMRVDLADARKTVRVDKYNARDNPVSWPGASVAGPVSYAWRNGVGGRSGHSLVITTIDGKVVINTPGQSAPLVVSLAAQDAPSTIISLGADADGNVYSGGFDLPAGIGRHRAATAVSSLLDGPQIEGFGAYGDGVVMGGYTGTTPSGPLYTYSGSGEPVLRTHLENGQERPVAIRQVGDKVAIGSVPIKNTLGGALSIWDPATNALQVQRNIVPDQSIVSLAAHGQLVVGGSSNVGGTGATPAAVDGKIFTYDMTTGTVRTLTPPRIASATYSWVAAITPDPAQPGYFWAISTGILIQFRVTPDGGVELTRNLGAFPQTSAPTGKGLSIEFVRGTLFATLVGTISAVNTTTGERAVVADKTSAGPVVGLVAVGEDLYFARGARLYRYRVTTASTFTSLAAPQVTSHDLSSPQEPGSFSFSGTGTRNATVTLTQGSRTRSTVVPDSGAWQLGAMDFTYGSYALTFSASLPGLPTTTTTAVLSVRDTSSDACAFALPTPTNVVVDGYNAPNRDYAFQGTGTPGTTITMVSGTRTRTATVRADGTWVMNPVWFGWWAGPLPFAAAAPGCATRVNNVPVTFAVQPAAHAAPSLLSHTSTTWYPAGDVGFSGKGTPGALVTARVGGQTRYASASSTGRWHLRALTVGTAPVTLELVSSTPGFPDREASLDVHFGAAPAGVAAPSVTSHTSGVSSPAGSVVFSGRGTPNAKISLSSPGGSRATFVRSTGRWDLPTVDVPAGSQPLTFVASSPGLPSAATTVVVPFV